MVVFAAGGILVRSDGRLCVLHRPRYDDWVLPKGKVESGESLPETALREVTEETRCDVELGGYLGRHQYDTDAGPKAAFFWRMRLVRERPFEPGPEIDRRVWLTPAEARDRLTYENERTLVTDSETDR
ncbi:NUDIX hydrolase [Halogeometricum limi]|uniref:8-oxo-dGTP diphosphatase n=1 Tax=Halogeometricum limi TaxID=555875 RepID=A0A1I6FRN8_9EURY|nr:NUDIX hydrolase [Halogeometricum limi]SFR32574.1 8-oxo-dGTP diphosphatase [Halogeometricum limi]